jgi:hypothetical protein
MLKLRLAVVVAKVVAIANALKLVDKNKIAKKTVFTIFNI